MHDIVVKIVENIPNGLYYVALAYIVWLLARLYFVRFRDLERKSSETSEINKKLDNSVSPALTKLSLTQDRIARYLITKDALDPTFFDTGSPIRLSALAQRLLAESGAKSLVDGVSDFVIDRIEANRPKSALDIQQLAVTEMFDMVDTEAFSRIKDFVYQNPEYEGHRVDLSVIINILAVYLRDKYLEKHPEMSGEE